MTMEADNKLRAPPSTSQFMTMEADNKLRAPPSTPQFMTMEADNQLVSPKKGASEIFGTDVIFCLAHCGVIIQRRSDLKISSYSQ